MLRAGIIFCVLVVAGCDVVTNRYDSIAEARRDRLFERGWLPDILPASAGRILVSNDLDINTSEGEFFFAPDDFSSFQARLSSDVPTRTPFADWAGFVSRHAAKDYSARAFSGNGSTWVFLCHGGIGHCVYRMWLVGSAD